MRRLFVGNRHIFTQVGLQRAWVQKPGQQKSQFHDARWCLNWCLNPRLQIISCTRDHVCGSQLCISGGVSGDDTSWSANEHEYLPIKQSIARLQSVQRQISIVAVCRAILSSEIEHLRQPSIRILTIVVPAGMVKVQPVHARKCKVGRSGRSSCFNVKAAHAQKCQSLPPAPFFVIHASMPCWPCERAQWGRQLLTPRFTDSDASRSCDLRCPFVRSCA